ncbi:hypothetical protein [Vibrio cidicii]|uniref:hypothetical protein n=1 Tax=Vibrio cidicii TaxID=1763883 RepID=UPI001112B932|nr:hypothetical protein [Vibrio cidicii]
MYDYEKDVKQACSLLNELEGALVISILVNVVEPEFNVVYLNTDKGVYALHGEVGGEYLGVRRLNELPDMTEQEGYIICKYPPFSMFEGRTISQARQVGSAWNGHGFEFTFDGVFSKSMLVQSIYCGTKPDELADCLRLGVGHYENTWSKT